MYLFVFGCAASSLLWRGLSLVAASGGYFLVAATAKLLQSCLTLCDPIDGSPPCSSVHGIFQARILEWVAIFLSRGTSPPRDGTWVSCIAGGFLTNWATREVAPLWREWLFLDRPFWAGFGLWHLTSTPPPHRINKTRIQTCRDWQIFSGQNILLALQGFLEIF